MEISESLDFSKVNEELFSFLDRSPVSFFAVRNMCRALEQRGGIRLYEGESWKLIPGRIYYVTRNDSSLIAFRLPDNDGGAGPSADTGTSAGTGSTSAAAPAGFHIMASHCDSPSFKVKTHPEIVAENRLVSLNVEKYGGALCEPWLDRPLSVAGRIVIRTPEGIGTRLVCIDRDLLIIPHLAIHMNRDANEGYKINLQKDMLPLFSCVESTSSGTANVAGSFLQLIAKEAGVAAEDILDTELYLYNRTRAAFLGLHNEFIGSGRLDDLQCVFASLQGFLQAGPSGGIAVHCVYDNEEVGSGTKQGAASTFLSDILHRINSALGGNEETYLRRLQSSFMLSADNAHSVHPNHPDAADPTNRPCLNEGIVLKYSANQKYTTDAVSGSLFRELCRAAKVPVQTFHNRSDQPGGSTLGNISAAQVAVNTVDIGLPQLAMHSSYEVAGAKDTAYLIAAAKVFFSCGLEGRGDGSYTIKTAGT